MYIIKNGTLVTPSGLLQADLAWENGKIVRVGQTECGADDTVYDAGGCFVLLKKSALSSPLPWPIPMLSGGRSGRRIS